MTKPAPRAKRKPEVYTYADGSTIPIVRKPRAKRKARVITLYLVYNKHGSVAFFKQEDAVYAATGERNYSTPGVNTLGHHFRDTFVDGHGFDDDEGTQFPIYEIRLPLKPTRRTT